MPQGKRPKKSFGELIRPSFAKDWDETVSRQGYYRQIRTAATVALLEKVKSQVSLRTPRQLRNILLEHAKGTIRHIEWLQEAQGDRKRFVGDGSSRERTGNAFGSLEHLVWYANRVVSGELLNPTRTTGSTGSKSSDGVTEDPEFQKKYFDSLNARGELPKAERKKQVYGPGQASQQRSDIEAKLHTPESLLEELTDEQRSDVWKLITKYAEEEAKRVRESVKEKWDVSKNNPLEDLQAAIFDFSDNTDAALTASERINLKTVAVIRDAYLLKLVRDSPEESLSLVINKRNRERNRLATAYRRPGQVATGPNSLPVNTTVQKSNQKRKN